MPSLVKLGFIKTVHAFEFNEIMSHKLSLTDTLHDIMIIDLNYFKKVLRQGVTVIKLCVTLLLRKNQNKLEHLPLGSHFLKIVLYLWVRS
jgi:hypothetical protein